MTPEQHELLATLNKRFQQLTAASHVFERVHLRLLHEEAEQHAISREQHLGMAMCLAVEAVRYDRSLMRPPLFDAYTQRILFADVRDMMGAHNKRDNYQHVVREIASLPSWHNTTNGVLVVVNVRAT